MRAASKSVVAGLLWSSEEWTKGFRDRLAFNQKKADPEVVRPVPVLTKPENVARYEVGRRKEIRSLLASIAGFCREQGIALFVTTPYGPYFSFTDAEMKNFPHHLYAGSVHYYGSERSAIEHEARLSIETVRKASIDFGFELIDLMSDLGHNRVGFSEDFSADGIHLTSKGNRRVGYRIAQELASRFRPLGGKSRL